MCSKYADGSYQGYVREAYQSIWRKKYLTREVPYEAFYYQSLDTDEILGEELLCDDSEFSTENKIMAKKVGLSQAAVHKRKDKVLSQLRMWMQL